MKPKTPDLTLQEILVLLEKGRYIINQAGVSDGVGIEMRTAEEVRI